MDVWPGYGDHMGWMWLWWPFGLGLLAWLLWMAARKSGASSAQDESPEVILKRRYARGEIDRDEYERKLKDLRT